MRTWEEQLSDPMEEEDYEPYCGDCLVPIDQCNHKS